VPLFGPTDSKDASRAVKEYLAILDDAAFGAASQVTPKFVSPFDPAAHCVLSTLLAFQQQDSSNCVKTFQVLQQVEPSDQLQRSARSN
jgi:hypothetical protein